MANLPEEKNFFRKCYKCDRKIFWGSFFSMGWDKDLETNILEEIWNNPIFILECCWCFNRKHYFNVPIKDEDIIIKSY